MDGIHDLGGMQGFGAVDHAPAEPVFGEPWEGRARALMEVVLGAVQPNGGEFRHAIERMDPGHYLTSSYYEHWLTAAATLAVEHGLFTREDLEAGAGGAFPLSGPVLAPPVTNPGADLSEPRFRAGDQVRVREWHPPGHTRCPRYIRGKTGVVVRLDGSYSVPDVEAHGSAPATSRPTRCGSTPRNCGPTGSTACACTWTCGTATWSRHERGRASPGGDAAGGTAGRGA